MVPYPSRITTNTVFVWFQSLASPLPVPIPPQEMERMSEKEEDSVWLGMFLWKYLLTMIMQIPEEERKNEPFLGVSGPAVCSFVSRGENVILLAQEGKSITQTGKMEAKQEATVWKTKRCNFPIWCFLRKLNTVLVRYRKSSCYSWSCK